VRGVRARAEIRGRKGNKTGVLLVVSAPRPDSSRSLSMSSGSAPGVASAPAPAGKTASEDSEAIL
jgi:hypothetical protein